MSRDQRIHIEGMGLLGSLLAFQLGRFGVNFTWDDIDNPKISTAWPASTGAIYPAGSTKFGPDWACYKVWARWFNQLDGLQPHLERCRYVFGHKSTLPHEGKGLYNPSEPTVHGLRMGDVPSFHGNAQTLVPAVRKAITRQRKDPNWKIGQEGLTIIRCHSFTEQMAYAYWGWTRLVELEYDSAYGDKHERPCFYFRPSKIQMAYAYPVPGTPYWYAGSSIIKQKLGKFKSLEMEPKYEKWKALFEQLCNGAARVSGESDFIEGWRPAPDNVTWPANTPWLRREGNEWTIRPMWNNGWRHFPYLWQQIASTLGIRDKSLQPLEEHQRHG